MRAIISFQSWHMSFSTEITTPSEENKCEKGKRWKLRSALVWGGDLWKGRPRVSEVTRPPLIITTPDQPSQYIYFIFYHIFPIFFISLSLFSFLEILSFLVVKIVASPSYGFIMIKFLCVALVWTFTLGLQRS